METTLMETTLIPMVLANSETWTNISVNNINELENLQKMMLTSIFHQKVSTPYLGMLTEIGVMTMESRIHQRKLMLLHNILTSDEKRLMKQVFQSQVKYMYNKCWNTEIQNILQKYNIPNNFNEIEHMTKNKWKKIVRNKIMSKLNQNFITYALNKTKLRFIKNNSIGGKPYINKMDPSAVEIVMSTRLNMKETKSNFIQRRNMSIM